MSDLDRGGAFRAQRTKVLSFPGLTSWNSMICQTSPSIRKLMPFLKSLVSTAKVLSNLLMRCRRILTRRSDFAPKRPFVRQPRAPFAQE